MSSDAKQGQLRDGEEKIKKLQTQLNMANNNREYQLLKEQIAATEMTNSVTADEILEELERIDEFAGKIVEVEAAVAKAQAEKDKVEKQFAEEEPSIRGDVARLEAELKEAEAVLPGRLQAHLPSRRQRPKRRRPGAGAGRILRRLQPEGAAERHQQSPGRRAQAPRLPRLRPRCCTCRRIGRRGSGSGRVVSGQLKRIEKQWRSASSRTSPAFRMTPPTRTAVQPDNWPLTTDHTNHYFTPIASAIDRVIIASVILGTQQ